MDSSGTSKKKAKVTIILEDMTSPDGKEGMAVDIVVDPEIKEGEELTSAQMWATAIVEMIYEASQEVVLQSDDGNDLEVIKGGTKDESEDGSELH